MAKQQAGKGPSWDTRPNPFADKAGGKATAHLADLSRLGLACDAVLSQGCALMFGLTRDGGAVVLTVLDGDQRHRTYCSNQVELEAAIDSLEFVYKDD